MSKVGKFNPLVSIVIPVYNGEEYIEEAIESALNQTYKNIEIIVVNDGSIDNTKNIVKTYEDKIFYYEKENGGVATALNLGISKMKGDYFSWLSHDDLYHPDKIKKQIELLEKSKDKNIIIGCNVNIVNANRELMKENKIPEIAKNNISAYLAFDQKIGLNGCSLLIPKKVFNDYGNFDENLKVTQDYDLWYRFSKHVKFNFVDDNLVFSRQHENQGSKKLISAVDYEVDRLHSRFIKNLSNKELLNYVNNNIDEYLLYFNQYKNMHCIRSASETAIKYVDLLLNSNRKQDAIKFLNEDLFNNSNEITINDKILDYKFDGRKKILFYNNIWVKGGIERVLTKIFQFLKSDYDIYFVAFNFSENKGFDLPSEIKLIQISDNLGYMLPSAILTICQLLNIDLFIGNQNLNLDFLPTYKYLSETSVKSIACNHYNYFLPFQVDWLRSIAYYRNEYYSYADIVTWATTICTDIYNGINNNGFYLPNPNTFNCLETFPNKKHNHIVSVARFDDAFKRLDLLLKVFSIVQKRVPDATLTIVGQTNMDMVLPATNDMPLSQYIKKLNISSNNIEFVGEQKEIKKYYEEAELFLFTSETEGFGMVINEAAAHATPTIAFDISGLEDLIVNGKNGYLVKKYEIEQMADIVIDYLNNELKKEAMCKAALKHVEKFNIDEIEKRWNCLLKSVFSENKYSAKADAQISKIVSEYENTVLQFPYYRNIDIDSNHNKVNRFYRFKYYLKTYGIRKTIIKVFQKMKYKLLGGKK